ncbi:MAG: hypothetical protein ACI4HN_06560 [Ruminococcus sp.]
MKKEYLEPEFELVRFILDEQLLKDSDEGANPDFGGDDSSMVE